MLQEQDHRRFSVRQTRKVLMALLLAFMLPGAAVVRAGSPIAFNNVSDADWSLKISQNGKTPVTDIKLDVTAASNILVQFSSQVEAVPVDEGCPCSVRAFLQIDDQAALPVKRINVGSPSVVQVDKYTHDRQELTGSLVFPVEAPGTHRFTLIVEQTTGKSTQLLIDYANLQAIAFPK